MTERDAPRQSPPAGNPDAPAAQAPATDAPETSRLVPIARAATLAAIVGLVVLGVAWEMWLAPLRPGGSMLALKVVPLLVALPGLWRGRRRSVQAMSLLIQLYLTEALVRATSDHGLSAKLAAGELALAGIAFAGVLAWARATRPAPPPASPAA